MGFAQVAVELDLSAHFTRLHNSISVDKFRPLHLRYLSYDAANNNFKLLLDKGDSAKGLSPSKLSDTLKGTVPEEELKSSTQELLNYFFVGISLPNDSFWVNLRPDSPDNVIDPYLAQTDVGKILLEADLQLKKDTSLATSPQTIEGKEYWNKLYKKAEELYGPESITIPTLTRPWIVPGEIIIRESTDNAYIYKATLKVMLEQDYLQAPSSGLQAMSLAQYTFKDERSKALNEYSTQLIKETIIPKLTKDVNTAKRYAPLRQVYYSLILAQWFKQKFSGKGGLYSYLIDKRELNNLTSKNPWDKQTYFKAYQTSFQKGEYNLKEPVYTPQGQVIRSYMSGGMNLGIYNINSSPVTIEGTRKISGNIINAGKLFLVTLLATGALTVASIGTVAANELDKKGVVDVIIEKVVQTSPDGAGFYIPEVKPIPEPQDKSPGYMDFKAIDSLGLHNEKQRRELVAPVLEEFPDAKKFFKYPERLSPKALREIAKNRLDDRRDDPRKLAVVLMAEGGGNDSALMWTKHVDDLMSLGYRVMYYEIKNIEDIVGGVEDATKTGKKIDFFSITSHSDTIFNIMLLRGAFRFSSWLTTSKSNEEKLKAAFQGRVSNYAIFALDTCFGGRDKKEDPGNFGNWFRRVLGDGKQDIWSTPTRTKLIGIERRGGMIIFYFNFFGGKQDFYISFLGDSNGSLIAQLPSVSSPSSEKTSAASPVEEKSASSAIRGTNLEERKLEDIIKTAVSQNRAAILKRPYSEKGDSGGVITPELVTMLCGLMRDDIARRVVAMFPPGEIRTKRTTRWLLGGKIISRILDFFGGGKTKIILHQAKRLFGGYKHAFLVVVFPQGKAYLVDTTFLQFFNDGLSETILEKNQQVHPGWSGLVERLLNEGYIELDDEVANMYGNLLQGETFSGETFDMHKLLVSPTDEPDYTAGEMIRFMGPLQSEPGSSLATAASPIERKEPLSKHGLNIVTASKKLILQINSKEIRDEINGILLACSDNLTKNALTNIFIIGRLADKGYLDKRVLPIIRDIIRLKGIGRTLNKSAILNIGGLEAFLREIDYTWQLLGKNLDGDKLSSFNAFDLAVKDNNGALLSVVDALGTLILKNGDTVPVLIEMQRGNGIFKDSSVKSEKEALEWIEKQIKEHIGKLAGKGLGTSQSFDTHIAQSEHYSDALARQAEALGIDKNLYIQSWIEKQDTHRLHLLKHAILGYSEQLQKALSGPTIQALVKEYEKKYNFHIYLVACSDFNIEAMIRSSNFDSRYIQRISQNIDTEVKNTDKEITQLKVTLSRDFKVRPEVVSFMFAEEGDIDIIRKALARINELKSVFSQYQQKKNEILDAYGIPEPQRAQYLVEDNFGHLVARDRHDALRGFENLAWSGFSAIGRSSPGVLDEYGSKTNEKILNGLLEGFEIQLLFDTYKGETGDEFSNEVSKIREKYKITSSANAGLTGSAASPVEQGTKIIKSMSIALATFITTGLIRVEALAQQITIPKPGLWGFFGTMNNLSREDQSLIVYGVLFGATVLPTIIWFIYSQLIRPYLEKNSLRDFEKGLFEINNISLAYDGIRIKTDKGTIHLSKYEITIYSNRGRRISKVYSELSGEQNKEDRIFFREQILDKIEGYIVQSQNTEDREQFWSQYITLFSGTYYDAAGKKDAERRKRIAKSLEVFYDNDIRKIKEIFPEWSYQEIIINDSSIDKINPRDVFIYYLYREPKALEVILVNKIEFLEDSLIERAVEGLLIRIIPQLKDGFIYGEERLDKDIILAKLKSERRFRIPGYFEEYISLLQAYVNQQAPSFQEDKYEIKETQARSWSYDKTERENIDELLSKGRDGRDFSGHLAMHQTKIWELFEAILTAGYIIPADIFETLNEKNQFQQMLKEGKVGSLIATDFVHFSIDKRIGYLNSRYAFVYPLEMFLENQAFILDPLSVDDWAVGGFSANPEHESHKIPVRNAIILAPKSEQENMEKLLSNLEQGYPGWQRPKRIFYYEGQSAEDGLKELQEKYNLKQPIERVAISRAPKIIRKLQEGKFKCDLIGRKSISLLSIKDVSDINGIIKYHDVAHLRRLQEVQDFSKQLEELSERVLSSMSIGDIEVKDTGSSKRGTYQERDSSFPDDFDLMVNLSGAVLTDPQLEEFGKKLADELQAKNWLKTIYGESEFRVAPESFISHRDGRSLVKIKVFRGNEQNIPVLLIDVNFFSDSGGADGIRYQQKFWENLDKILSGLPEKDREEGKQHILAIIRSLKAIFKNNGVYGWVEGGLRGVGTEQLSLQLNGVEDEFGTPKNAAFTSIDDFKKIYSITNALFILEEAMFNGQKYSGLEGFRKNLPLWDPGSLSPTRLTDRVNEMALRRLIDITTEAKNSLGNIIETATVSSAASPVTIKEIDAYVIKNNSLEVETGIVTAGGIQQEVVLDKTNVPPKYLRVGDIIIKDKELIMPDYPPLKKYIVLTVNTKDHLEFADYAIPFIAAMLNQEFEDKIVEEDGIGTGILSLIALKKKAKRIVGIESVPEKLTLAKEVFESEGYTVKQLKLSDWRSDVSQEAEKIDYQVILIEGKLSDWYKVAPEEREKIAGGRLEIRLAELGPMYKIHPELVSDALLKYKNENTILGGYLDGTGNRLGGDSSYNMKMGIEEGFREIALNIYKLDGTKRIEKLSDLLEKYGVRVSTHSRESGSSFSALTVQPEASSAIDQAAESAASPVKYAEEVSKKINQKAGRVTQEAFEALYGVIRLENFASSPMNNVDTQIRLYRTYSANDILEPLKLNKEDVYVDLAGGPGTVSAAAASMAGRVIYVDISEKNIPLVKGIINYAKNPSVLEALKEKPLLDVKNYLEKLKNENYEIMPATNVEILLTDAQKLPLADNSVSKLSVTDVFHWISQRGGKVGVDNVIKEMLRVTKSGGLLHIKYDFPSRSEEFIEYFKQLAQNLGVEVIIIEDTVIGGVVLEVKNKTNASSSLISDKGGIDLRALPITTQPINLGLISANLRDSPQKTGTVPSDRELKEEWARIENMLAAGLIPSSERIKEYLQSCCQKQDYNQEIDKVLSCIADILRLEEERVASTDSALKEVLVLLELDKPVEQMQLALAQITVEPKEPKTIEQ